MLTLNTPIAPPQVTGFDVSAVTVRLDSAMVDVVYFQIANGVRVGNPIHTAPVPVATWDALPGPGMRLKALNAVAADQGLAGGTYVIA